MVRIWIPMSLISAAALFGCGGGGGGLTVAGGSSTMTGAVMDGLIENAKVCLDVNGNLLCDTNEPYAMTDKDGKYSISYPGSVDGLHVIAEVTENSKDADDNGQTIKQAGKEPFNLASPATRPEVVTPLTTLVTHAIVADPNLKTDADSLKKAEETVKASTGLKADLLGNNYVQTKDTSVHDVAKVISVALGDVAKEVKAGIDAQKGGDSELTAALDTVAGQKNIQAKVVAAATNLIASAIDSTGKLVKSADAIKEETRQAVTNVVSGQINNIILGTKSGEAKLSNAENIFKNGLIVGSPDSDYLENGTPYKDNLQIEFLKGNRAEKVFYATKKVLYIDNTLKPSWENRRRWGRNYVLGKNNKWIYSPDLGEGPTTGNGDIEFQGNCMILKPDVDQVTANDMICFVEKDISGKKIKSLLKGYCDQEEKKAFPACKEDAEFKPGSIAYDITLSVTEDQYSNSVGFNSNGYGTTDNQKTISAFIDATKKFAQSMGDGCNTRFRIKSYDSTLKTGVMEWADYSNYTCSTVDQKAFSSEEETAFEVKVVGGTEMLILDISTIYKKNNNNDGVGMKFIFNYMEDAEINRSGIFKGELRLKSAKRQLDFSGDVKIGSPALLDSFLDGLGMQPYPYSTTPIIKSK